MQHTKLFLLMMLAMLSAHSQDLLLEFQARHSCAQVELDSIWIENLTHGGKMVLYHPENTVVFTVTSIGDLDIDQDHLHVTQNYPNPFTVRTYVDLHLARPDKILLNVHDLKGRLVARHEDNLQKGNHRFSFIAGEEKTYILTVESESHLQQRIMFHKGTSASSTPAITYLGASQEKATKTAPKSTDFNFSPGDELRFTGYVTDVSGNTDYGVILDAPEASEEYLFDIANTMPDQPSVISGEVNVPENVTGLVYEVEEIEGLSYLWSVPEGWEITHGQGSQAITVDAGSEGGDVSVKAENACGLSEASVLMVETYVISDGFYVTGEGTALPEPALEGLMLVTRNQVTQQDRPELLELFVAAQAGPEGFYIVEESDAERTSYGPGSDFAVVGEDERIPDEPQLDFWRGSYVESEDPFTVPEDGLYHVAIDTELGVVIVVPVAYWGVIGSATPDGWAGDIEMHADIFDLNTMTFMATDIPMTAGDYKLRYSGGWNVVIDDDAGVRINTNYGGAIDDLIPGGANLDNDEDGLYTVEMVWTLGEPYEASIERTGDIDQDGAPFLNVPGSYQGWDPTNDQTVVYSSGQDDMFEGYQYFNANETEYKYAIGSWDEYWGDNYADGTLDAGGSNIVAEDAGVYKLNVDMQAMTHEFLLTEWAVIGDALSGWVTDIPMDFDMEYWEENWKVRYIITTQLNEGVFKFRANGYWDPPEGLNYGIDDEAEEGVLIQGGFGNDIPVDSQGDYTIILDLSGPVYTYELIQH